MSDLFGAANQHRAGDRTLPRSVGSEGTAVFGGTGDCYRYSLARDWNRALPAVLFVMMNPSTATAFADDATVAKVTKFARRWGFGRLLIGNVYAYRCADQARLVETADPVGPDNDGHLLAMAAEAQMIVMAYGTPKIVALRARGPAVARMLLAAGHKLHALRISKSGVPWHPLYLPDETAPMPWGGSDERARQPERREHRRRQGARGRFPDAGAPFLAADDDAVPGKVGRADAQVCRELGTSHSAGAPAMTPAEMEWQT